MQIGNSVRDSVYDSLKLSVRNLLSNSVSASLNTSVWLSVIDSTWLSVSESPHILTYDMLWAPITNITQHSSWLLMINKANGTR